jgi:hypothetical protein
MKTFFQRSKPFFQRSATRLCSARTLSAAQWLAILIVSGLAVAWGTEAAGLVIGVLRGVAP